MTTGVMLPDSEINRIKSVIYSFHLWLETTVGDTPDNPDDYYASRYLINTAGMMSNDLHYLDKGGNGTPSGTTTTETQSTLVLGYIYMYEATGDPLFLEKAEYYWQAYFDNFYLGKSIPPSRQVLHCHWMLNGKQPIASAHPLNEDDHMASGWLGPSFTVSNNMVQIPHGSPYYGDILQKVTFGFEGNLVWESVLSRVVSVDNWSLPGIVYEIEWFINYEGRQIDTGGDEVGDNPEGWPYGTVKFTGRRYWGEIYEENYIDTITVNRSLRFNFASHNGVDIGRNAPFDPRPLWVPLQDGYEGNASDAEQWFGDACKLLYDITGKDQYNIMSGCVTDTVVDYAHIDDDQRFWRESDAQSPYTDGISYSYYFDPLHEDLPDPYRGSDLFIVCDHNRSTDGFTRWFEQQAIWYKCTNNTKITSKLGSSADCNVSIMFETNVIKTDNLNIDGSYKQQWIMAIDNATGTTPKTTSIPMTNARFSGSYVKVGDHWELQKSATELFNIGRTYAWGNAEAYAEYEYNILNNGRNDIIVHCQTLPYGDGAPDFNGWTIDFSYSNDPLPLGDIVYRTEGASFDPEFTLLITSSAGHQYSTMLPHSAGWTKRTLTNSMFSSTTISGVWPGELIDQIELSSRWGTHSIYLYSFGDVPKLYNVSEGQYLIFHQIEIDSPGPSLVKVGNCVCTDYALSNLSYTPGMVPFSNNYSPTTDRYGAWQGQPYMGYQYGAIYWEYCDPSHPKHAYWDNIAKAHYDSQQDYYARRKDTSEPNNLLGPQASAYVWDRWDNVNYGEPDTWTDQIWGDTDPWSGYMPRTMLSAGRMHEVDYIERGKVDSRLSIVMSNWIDYLYKFGLENDGGIPTAFPSDQPPYNDRWSNGDLDFGGHMEGNFLSGTLKYAVTGGMANPNTSPLIHMMVENICRNQVIMEPGEFMNGSFSSWPEGGQFFGFWYGDIVKALSMYIMYHNWLKAGQPPWGGTRNGELIRNKNF